MGMKAWNLAVLGAVTALWVATGTQREKPLVSEAHADRVRAAEDSAATAPRDPARLAALAQSYLDAHAPGMAVQVVESAPPELRGEPRVLHVYARALIDQGHAAEALQVERKVLDLCATPEAKCSSYLIASATRRADILNELVQLGVEDAQAHPEKSALAYHNATRQVGLSLR